MAAVRRAEARTGESMVMCAKGEEGKKICKRTTG